MLAAPATAQEKSIEYIPSHAIRVTNQATVTSRPDQAQIDFGVVTQAATAQAAADQNAQQLDAVVTALRQALPAEASIDTLRYTLTPQYQHPQEGKVPIVSGYSVTNTVRVRTDQLTEVGTIIDVALRAGANQVTRLQFTLKDEHAVQAQALRMAAQHARAQAETLAAAVGVELGDVLSLTASEPAPIQPLGTVAMRAQTGTFAPPTPIEPGLIEVYATVTLTVAIRELARASGAPPSSQLSSGTNERENIPVP